jgi:phenylacetate-CoA ligase
MDHSPCPHCGRTSERVVGPVVRTKDLIKVKGMLINPDVLLDTLQSMTAIAEFQIVIQHKDQTDPLSMDEMLIRVAVQTGTDAAIGVEIVAQTNRAVNVTPRVEFVEIEEIYTAGTQTKAVRFVDRRTPIDSTVR